MFDFRKFPIEDVILDARCQSRADIRLDAVDEYAANVDALPPIDVFLVVGKPYVVDGFHRYTAHLKAGTDFVRCKVVGSGTIDEAAWRSTGVNQAHGIRRSNEDKRRAVRLALENPIGAEQSTAVVAEHVGVSPEFVSKVRGEIEASRRAVQVPTVGTCGVTTRNHTSEISTSEPKKVRGKDGKLYPAKKPRAEKPKAASLVARALLPDFAPTIRDLAEEIRGFRLRALRLTKDTTVHTQSLEAAMRDVERQLSGAIPEACPKCAGEACDRCGQRGWVTANESASMRATAKALGREVLA